MQDNDNTHDHEQKVRDRAYALWEEEGRPEGREHDHWHRAHHEVNGGGGFADSQNGAVNTGASNGGGGHHHPSEANSGDGQGSFGNPSEGSHQQQQG